MNPTTHRSRIESAFLCASLAPISRLERAGRSRLERALRARNRDRRIQAPKLFASPHGERTDASGVGEVPRGFRNPLAPFAPTPSRRVVLPVIGSEDELTPVIERSLIPIVIRAASGDRIARDVLYAALEPKLMRCSRRIVVPAAPTRDEPIWDWDDVTQEVYLAFLDVIDAWEEGIPFGSYLLSHFARCLQDRISHGARQSLMLPSVTLVAIDRRDQARDDAGGGFEAHRYSTRS